MGFKFPEIAAQPRTSADTCGVGEPQSPGRSAKRRAGRGFPLSPGRSPQNAEEERADRGRYLSAVQGLRRGQDGDVLEGVLSLLRGETRRTQAVRTSHPPETPK